MANSYYRARRSSALGYSGLPHLPLALTKNPNLVTISTFFESQIYTSLANGNFVTSYPKMQKLLKENMKIDFEARESPRMFFIAGTNTYVFHCESQGSGGEDVDDGGVGDNLMHISFIGWSSKMQNKYVLK